MPTVKNLSYGPITIELAERSITLGPRESVEILNVEADSPDLLRNLREDRLFVIPSAKASPEAEAPPAAEAPVDKKDKPAKPNQ